MERSEKSGHVESIDYLKAVFIIFVIVNHSHVLAKSNPFYLFMVQMAVPCFLLLSGWTFSMSSVNKEFREMYNPYILLKRFLRFTIPILPTFLLCICTIMLKQEKTLNQLVLIFLLGNYGAGAYYYLIMIQFILLFPVLYYLVKKAGFHGVILIGLINFLFELSCTYYSINKEINDVIIGRYLLFIGVGIYFYLNPYRIIKNEHLLILLITGIMYILLPHYFGYEYKIFQYWSITSMVVICYIAPLFYLFFRYLIDCQIKGKAGLLLKIIGRSSYHIMCTQMAWFSIKERFTILQIGGGYKVIIDIIICVVSGICFYYINEAVMKRINKIRMI